jgi:lipopolysaccharide export LptBFGC system permease protein LptF
MMFPIFPLLLLLTALFSIYLYQRSANEVYRVLGASLAVVCLVWGFAVAHWSVLLFCLLLLVKPNPIPLLQRITLNQ